MPPTPDPAAHTTKRTHDTTAGADRAAAKADAQARAARGPRLAAALIGGAFLLLLAAFMLFPLLAQDEVRLNPVGPIAAGPGQERGGLVFTGTVNIWEVRGRMTQDAQRQARFELHLMGPNGQPAPASLPLQLLLERLGETTPPLQPALSRTGPGTYAAVAALPAAGAWRLRLALPEISGIFVFDAE